MTTQKSLYESDFYAWCHFQASSLREGKLSNLDITNLTEEIESMGRKEKRELINRLTIAIAHILKWIYQSDRQCRSWASTIQDQKNQIEWLLEDNPSLKPLLNECLERAYKYSRKLASEETGIFIEKFPEEITSEITKHLWE